MTLLYIEGELVDIGGDDISITLQSIDIGSLSVRSASYTNRIKLPKTPKNVSLLGGLALNGSWSNAPYNRLKCKLMIEGVELFSDGYCLITEATDTYYAIRLFDGVKGLDDALGGRKLSDLNFSNTTINGVYGANLNHILNRDAIVNSFNNTGGYIYLPRTYSVYGSSDRTRGQLMPCCIFYKTIIDEIFRQNGLSYSCSLMELDTIKKLVVAPAKGWDIGSPSQTVLVNNPIDSYEVQLTNGFFTKQLLSYIVSNSGHSNYKITIPNIRTQLYIEDTYNTNTYVNYSWKLQVKINNSTVVYDRDLVYDPSSQEYDGEWGGYSGGGDVEVTLKNNDLIEVNLIYEVNYPYVFDSARVKARSVDPLIITNLNYNIPIDFSELLGDITQASFIKDFMLMFGLFMKLDEENNRHYIFHRLEETLQLSGEEKNWSNYVSVEGIQYSYTPSFIDLNFATNTFNFQYEDQEHTENFNSSLIIENANISSEGSMIDSVFTITKNNTEVLFSNDLIRLDIYPSFIHLFDYQEFDNSWSYKPYESSLKVFYLDRETFTGTLPFLFGDASYSTLTYEVNNTPLSKAKIGNDKNRSIYAKDIIDIHYNRVKKLLDKYTKVKVNAALPLLDALSFDQSKLIYLRQTGRYYYLNKIEKFIPGKICTLELFQIPID